MYWNISATHQAMFVCSIDDFSCRRLPIPVESLRQLDPDVQPRQGRRRVATREAQRNPWLQARYEHSPGWGDRELDYRCVDDSGSDGTELEAYFSSSNFTLRSRISQ
jgi:hypothetical protein